MMPIRFGDFAAKALEGIRAARERQLERLPDGSFWCPEHDTAISASSPALTCQGCVRDADRRAATERRLERVAEAWGTTDLPKWPWARLGATSWQQSAPPRVITAVTKWDMAKSMVIMGPTGSCKTSSLVARINQIHGEAQRWARDLTEGPCPLRPVLYTTEHRLVASRRNRPLGHGESPLVEAAMSSPVLVLDELGAANDSVSAFVIDERIMVGLPTVALSGFGPVDLAARVGEHCFRRVFDDADVRCNLFSEASRG
jgi:hypothetical protein